MKKETRRINFNIPVDTLERVDEYADNMSINRTSALLVLLSQALDGQKALTIMDEMLKTIKSEQEKSGQRKIG